MNPATNVAPAEHVSPREEETVRLAPGWCWLAGTVWFALPLAQWWRVTGDADGVVAFGALVVAFGWWASRTLQTKAPRTSVGAALGGLGLVVLDLWLLAWVRVEDFWILRWSWFVLAVAATLLLWGWAGPARALRPLLAFVAWAVLPPGALPFVESPRWLCEATANIAGFCLWQQQDGASVQGTTIHLPTGSVLVGGGCTVLPLWLSLAHLFVPAWLIFQLSWRRALGIAAIVAIAAAVLSIVRVMIMAVVVADSLRFNYWHGPTGASWFTAAGMLTLAWLIDRALRNRSVSSEPATMARGQAWTLGVGAGASAAVALAGFFGGPEQFAPPTTEAPAVPNFTLTRATEHQLPPWQIATGQFPFVWERRAVYDAALSGQRITVRLCFAPRLLTGDPVQTVAAYGWLARDAGAWAEVPCDELGDVRASSAPGRCRWVATIAPDAPLIANEAAWNVANAARLRQPATWLRWFAGRAPLRDKRACWIEIGWTGTGLPPEKEMRAAVASWRVLAQESFSAR